eukprot:gene9662-11452_t
MEPSAVAAALSAGSPSADEMEHRAAALGLAKPDVCYQVASKMSDRYLGKFLKLMSSTSVGRLLAYYPYKWWPKLLQVAGINSNDSSEHLQQARIYVDVRSQISSSTSSLDPAEIAKQMKNMDPRHGMYLLAKGPAQRVGSILEELSMLHSDKMLAKESARMDYLSKTFRSEDISASKLLQHLTTADTDQELYEGCMSVMQFYQKAFDLSCTLTRVQDHSDVGLDPEVEELATSTSGPAPVSTDFEVVTGVDKIEVSQAEISLSVNTPEIMDSPRPLGEEALLKQEVVHRGAMLTVPIFTMRGARWGCITHIVKSDASKAILGGVCAPAPLPCV